MDANIFNELLKEYINNSDASMLLPKTASNLIRKKILQHSEIRKLATVTKTDKRCYKITNGTSHEVFWCTDKNQKKNTIETQEQNINLFPLCSSFKLNKALLESDDIETERIIDDRVIPDIATKEDHAFLYGDGKQQPMGLLRSKNITEIKYNKSNIFATMLSAISQVKGRSMRNYCWFVQGSFLEQIYNYKDHTLYNIMSLNQNKLFGCPIVVSKTLKTEDQALLIDWKASYHIVDYNNMTILRGREGLNIDLSIIKQVGGGYINDTNLVVLRQES